LFGLTDGIERPPLGGDVMGRYAACPAGKLAVELSNAFTGETLTSDDKSSLSLASVLAHFPVRLVNAPHLTVKRNLDGRYQIGCDLSHHHEGVLSFILATRCLLGSLVPAGVNFSIYAKHATAVRWFFSARTERQPLRNSYSA